MHETSCALATKLLHPLVIKFTNGSGQNYPPNRLSTSDGSVNIAFTIQNLI